MNIVSIILSTLLCPQENKNTTHTPPILPQPRHPPLLQIPIEERTEQRRQDGALGYAYDLAIVAIPDLSNFNSAFRPQGL